MGVPEELKENTVNMQNSESFVDQDGILFPNAKKGELTDIAGYYVIEERDEQEKQKTMAYGLHQ